MQLVTGTSARLPQGLYAKVSRYRHEVFVQRLGWQLQTPAGEEIDQFDRSDTVYLVAEDDTGQITGCGRLLPTTRPYLLAEVFPQLMNGAPPPSTADVWELSRFCTVDLNAKVSSPMGQFSSALTVDMMHAAVECGARLGAKQLISVSPVGVERLLRRAGFHCHRAGPPMIIDGHAIFACLIETGGH